MEAVFRSVKRACYAGLDSVRLRQEVARRCAALVPYDGYAFSVTDPDTGLLTHTVGDGIPGSLVTLYSTHYYPAEAAIVQMDRAIAGDPVYSMFARSPALASATRRSGLHYEISVNLADGDELWGNWCLLRTNGAGSAASTAKSFLARVIPHVTRGLRMAALVDSATERDDATPPLSGPAVLVLDARGRMTARTGSARAMLEDLADVGVDMAHTLPVCVTGLHGWLRRKQRLAGEDSPADARVRARGRSGRWYTLTAALAEPDCHGSSSEVIVIERIRAPERAALLSRLYGLSSRERQVTALVVRGLSTKRIARRLGISPHTVKEHIERASAKIGVSGRKALVARLYFDAFAPPLSGDAPR